MVYVLLGTGFEETEAIAPIDLLRRAGAKVLTVGIGGKVIRGSHHICVEADITVDQVDPTQLDMLVLPGGLGGVASIEGSPEAMELIRFACENHKLIGAICAAPTILGKQGMLQGMAAVCYPGCEKDLQGAIYRTDVPCVRSGNIITGTSAGCAVPFGLALIEALKGQEEADRIARQIVIR